MTVSAIRHQPEPPALGTPPPAVDPAPTPRPASRAPEPPPVDRQAGLPAGPAREPAKPRFTDRFRQRTPGERAAALLAERDAAQAVLAVQGDPALTEALSSAELAADRQVAEDVRAAQRAQRRRSQLAQVDRANRDQRTEDREADIDAADRVWHRRALSARRRALSPNARLAQLARARRWIMLALTAEVVIGVLVSATTVQHNMAGHQDWHDTGWWAWFFVDPLLSVPLVLLLVVRTIGMQWGRTLQSAPVVATEIGLLATMGLLNVGPYLAHPVRAGVAGIAGHLIAPGATALGVLLAAAISAFFAQILAEAVVDVDDPGRLDGNTAKVIEGIARVRQLMAEGVLLPDLDSPTTPWLPSANQIQRRLAIAKPIAVAIHDALERLYPAGANPAAGTALTA